MIAPANTGRDINSNTAVINTDQINKGVFSNVIPLGHIFITVEMKLIAPRIDEIPAICSEKIAISTDGPICEMFLDSGG